MESRIQIRQFIAGHVAGPVADDDDIFEAGLVNSMFVVQLVAFVEHAFGLTLRGSDLTLADLCSIDAVDALVSRRSPAA
jgi:acyl carrier protein